MLKHLYASPAKQRSKSQSSDTSFYDDSIKFYSTQSVLGQQQLDFGESGGLGEQVTTATSSWYHNQSDDDDNIKVSSSTATKQSTKTKISRRRPPSGAENAVRRWNSFHSTRGECHPNKFRRERKSTSPSIDLGSRRNFAIGSGNNSALSSGSSSPSRRWELRRGKSLACDNKTKLETSDYAQSLLLAGVSATPAASVSNRETKQRAVSIW